MSAKRDPGGNRGKEEIKKLEVLLQPYFVMNSSVKGGVCLTCIYYREEKSKGKSFCCFTGERITLGLGCEFHQDSLSKDIQYEFI